MGQPACTRSALAFTRRFGLSVCAPITRKAALSSSMSTPRQATIDPDRTVK
ncbi:Uncharacterised protein [Mycobacteroides abscessus subsp. massiliense]|nr:Uncharacterised protein [Mycobacteroides abscessus subsp. massiliense]